MNHKKTWILIGTIIIAAFICPIFPAQTASQVQVKSNEETLLKFDTDSGLVIRLYRKNQEQQIYINIFDKNKSSFIANEASVKNIENNQEENWFWESFKIFLPPLANASAFLLIGLLLWFNRFKIIDFINKLNLTSFSFGDLKIELLQEKIKKAYDTKRLTISEGKKSELENILKHSALFVEGKSILWIDDYPKNNQNECEIFSQLKINLKSCRTSDEAKKELSDPEKRYDLIISDWNRKPQKEDNKPEGQRFVEEICRENYRIPVIFYHGTYEDDSDKDNKINAINNFCNSHQQITINHTSYPKELIILAMKELVSSSLLPLLKSSRF